MNEVSEGKLARLALVGAIALGVAAGNAAQVSNREINNWKRDFNSLTIKDKKKVLGMIDVKEGKNPVAKNINKFNKPKTFTDRKKRDKRGYEKHKGKKLIMGQKEIEEKLSPSHGIKAYIDDFQKSDAPQFQGKSAEKRRDMAIAAYLSAKRGTNEEVEQVDELKKSTLQSYLKKSAERKRAPKHYKGSTGEYRAQDRLQGKMYTNRSPYNAVTGEVDPKKYKGESVDQVDEKTSPEDLNRKAMKRISKNPHDEKSMKVADRQRKLAARLITKRDMPNAARAYNPKRLPEDVEHLDELKKSTLQSYANKASRDKFRQVSKAWEPPAGDPRIKKHLDKAKRRADGVKLAKNKIAGSAKVGGTDVTPKQLHNMRMKAIKKEDVDRCVFDEIMEGFGALDESQKLANKRAELRKKMFGDANYLSPAQRKELDKAAKAELKKEKAAKKAAPAPKSTTKTSKGKTHTGSAEAADKHIIMQMRKAQDYGAGKHPIRVSPTRTVKVPHTLINKALEKHDAMVKPEAKRTFRIQLIRSLRKAGK